MDHVNHVKEEEEEENRYLANCGILALPNCQYR
jgi:predicted metal-binding protein